MGWNSDALCCLLRLFRWDRTALPRARGRLPSIPVHRYHSAAKRNTRNVSKHFTKRACFENLALHFFKGQIVHVPLPPRDFSSLFCLFFNNNNNKTTTTTPNLEDVPLVQFIYLVFPRIPGESYLSEATQVFVVVLVSRVSSANSVSYTHLTLSLIHI